MTDQSRLELTDAILEKMLLQRAGPGAPADLVPAIAAAIETTGQRAPGLPGTRPGPAASRTRRDLWHVPPARILQAAALALAAVTVATGASLFLRQSPAVIGGPSSSPSLTPVPSGSVEPSSRPSPTPTATPRPAAEIAFIMRVERGGMGDTGRVWIVGADATGAHELFPGGTRDQSGVAWSPDGTRLVYSEAGRLFLTDARGRAPQVVDTGCGSGSDDRDPAFSGDGSQLVFEHGCTGRIATIDLASNAVVDLDATHSYSDRPKWSPDGKQIAFSTGYKSDGGPAVYVVDEDGQNLRRLTPASLPGRFPEWSPDGSQIVFTSYLSEILRTGANRYEKLDQDIYTVRLDWTHLRRLTSDGISIGATWTPDGRILFGRLTHDGGQGEGSLWSMDADGSNAERLVSGLTGNTSQPYLGFDAAWQPTP